MLMLIADCYGKMIRFPLTDDLQEITIGSLPENHLSIPYQGVSRRHALLKRDQTGWRLQDLGSTNGTKLNGKKVHESPLKPDDLVQIGIVELKVASTDPDKLIRLPEAPVSGKQDTRTDKIADIANEQKRNIFASARLVFPEGMIPGTSPVMIEIYQKLHSIVDSDISVLLGGETGTGKEMFAKLLHLSGKHSHGPFIAVNCAAIPADLMEAELFGIGAKVATDVSQRKGTFAAADGGTLFLDELGAFPIEFQAKVLRAIEEKSVVPVGTYSPVKTDFRLVCATNEDPQELMRSGKLREDLYHRVSGVEIVIPPLRERKEDMGPMIIGLLQQICLREKKGVAGVSTSLMQILTSYSYPGNVRELTHLLNAMVAMAHPGEMLDVHLAPGKLLQTKIPQESDPATQEEVDLPTKLNETSRLWIIRALHRHNGNITAAAKTLGVTRFGLRKMMKRLGID